MAEATRGEQMTFQGAIIEYGDEGGREYGSE